MSKIDWTGELEAYHEDGRVVPVTLAQNGPDDDGDYVSNEEFRDGYLQNWYWTPEGLPSPSVGAQGMKWRIRNVQLTPSTDRLARLEDFVARVAGGHPSSGFVWNDQAKALVAELNPVDPDVLVARKIALKHALPGAYDGITTYECNEGKADDKPYMVAIIEALRQARKEGNDNGK